MKIYVAGSFNNADKIRMVAQRLREAGISCYVFCDKGEVTEALSVKLRRDFDVTLLKPNTALRSDVVQMIGKLNLAALKECDAVVVVLPSGKSAHMEAGFMAGRDRPVWIYGPMTRGEFDAMYVMARGVYDEHEFKELVDDILNFHQTDG